MAYRHVRASFGRIIISIVAVALGVALVVAVQLMNAAVLNSFLNAVDAVAGRAALTVTAGDGVTFPEAVAEMVATIPGVELAVPLVSAVAFPDDGSGEPLTVHGIDLTNDAAVRVYRTRDAEGDVLDDLLLFLNQPRSILLGQEYAMRRGLRVGSSLALVTPNGVEDFTVRGIVDPEGLARTLQGRLIVMDLFAAERAFTTDGQVNRVDIVLKQDADFATTKNAVARVLPSGLTLEEPAFRKDAVRRTVGGFQAMLTAFSLLAILAGFVICYGRLSTVFDTRTWEIGLLRAVGLRRAIVLRELLKESFLWGTLGTAVGVPVGIAIAQVGLPLVAQATAINFRLPAPATALTVEARALFVGATVGLLAATLAALVPALRLARTHPVAALTLRGREVPAVRHIHWRAGSLLVVIVVGLIVAQSQLKVAVLGHITTALMAIASFVVATPVVRLASRVLTSVRQRTLGPAGRFAIAQLDRQPRRTATTVATLTVGLGTVLLFGILAFSFERTLISRLTSRFSADLIVSSAFVSGGYRSAPLSDSLLQKLREVHGVALVVGNQAKDVSYADTTITIDSYDPPCFEDRRVCDWPLDPGASPDALAQVGHGTAVLVSSTFAYQQRARVGDVIRLASPNGPIALTVAGVTNGQAENAIVMSRDLYRRAWNDGSIYLAHVTVDKATAPGAAREAISRSLGTTYHLHVRSSAQLIEFFAGQVREGFSLLFLMEAITFTLVLVGIGDTLAASVIERTREFGMMRAVGFRRSQLSQVILLEGQAIGLLGLLLAMVLGLALGVFWVELHFPALVGWTLSLSLPTRFVLTAAALTLLLCGVGSVLPAVRASRLSVPAALRAE